jgi:hypothetical protein
MQSIAIGERPSIRLAEDGYLPDAWSPFDDALETALIEFTAADECPDVLRRELLSWFGGYLTRLLGAATGRLGNAAVIKAWKHCFELCCDGQANLPMDLGSAIRALLYPAGGEGRPNTILVPAFAARAEPLRPQRDGLSAKLAEYVYHDAIGMRIRRAGGRMLLECIHAGTANVLGQLVLDFPLLREALACHGGRAGQTESTPYLEPRIERCRASTLEAMPDTSRHLVAISGADEVELRI